MSEKKNLILYIVIIFVAAVIIALSWIALLWKDTSYPYCEMPRVVFSYRNDGNDIYVFDSEGYIYKISRFSGKTDRLASLMETIIQCLEENREEAWLEKVGTTNKEILQEKYNIFRKVVDNPKYAVFCTTISIPAMIDSPYSGSGCTDYWYGLISNTKGMYFYHTGYKEYDVTDKTIYQVVDWIRDEAKKYDK